MNRKRIGLFIAECRKAKGFTQQQLAEKLQITDKSVSKWERGTCLPDASLYQPLCDLLGISIGELFAGEKSEHGDTTKYLLRLLEQQLYDASAGITFAEFHHALEAMAETTLLLSGFPSYEQAVEYLVRETGLSVEECSKAYDLYMAVEQRMRKYDCSEQ